jgi:hypothetical protein
MGRLILLMAGALRAALLFGVVHSARAGRSHQAAARIQVLGRCPSHALPLPADAVARAADQARIEAPAIYGKLGVGARMVASQVATSGTAGPRGHEAEEQCGARVAKRTVVVDLFLPRGLPSASLSEATVFVSLAPVGYRIWEVAH